VVPTLIDNEITNKNKYLPNCSENKIDLIVIYDKKVVK